MGYIGDFVEDAIVRYMWDSNDAAGASITRATDGSIRIYKDNGVAQKTTSNGITDTEDFDGVVGIHALDIDTGNDTGDVGFWVTGSDYMVVLVGATIDGQTVNAVLCTFSIENRSHALASVCTEVRLAELGAANLPADVDAIKAKTDNLPADPASATGPVGSVTGSIGSLDTQAKADVNAEMVDVNRVDTVPELTAVPAENAPIHTMMQWIFSLTRNKRITTSVLDTLRNDDDSADIGSAVCQDAGGTFTRHEFS